MAEAFNLLKRVRSLEVSPELSGYSGVRIYAGQDDEGNSIEYFAGNETGKVLEITNDWGTQAQADAISKKILGYRYQPYTATGSQIDPSVELGDAVTISDTYGGVFSRRSIYGKHIISDVSAPFYDEIEHEFQIQSPTNRQYDRFTRQMRASLSITNSRIMAEMEERKSDVGILNSKLTVQANLIATEVSERKKDSSELRSSITQESNRITAEVSTRAKETASLRATLDIQAGQITAKVNKNDGNSSTFGWALETASWRIFSGSNTVLKADKNGLEVKGVIRATSGEIGGFEITSNSLTYNNQTWGGTNTNGIYIGPSGIQLGKNFKVDSAGNLTAASGTFSGYVKAGNIQYGGNDGTLDGYALTGGTVTGGYGGAICGGSLSTYNMTGGINTSLGRADWAYNALNGWTNIPLVKATAMQVSGKMLVFTNITFVNSSGGTTTMPVVTWRVA